MPRALTDEQDAKIRRMLEAGTWTYAQIARGVKCSLRPVSQRAREMGIDRTDLAAAYGRTRVRHGKVE